MDMVGFKVKAAQTQIVAKICEKTKGTLGLLPFTGSKARRKCTVLGFLNMESF